MIHSLDGEARRNLTQMRVASLIEGTTLVILLLVAVPLKHLLGLAVATAVMGPIHGLAFVFYIWTMSKVVSAGGWSRADIAWMSIAAIIPFGAFFNEGMIDRRKAARLKASAE